MNRWIGLFFLTACFLGWMVVVPKPNDAEEYQELTSSSADQDRSSSTQNRKLVQKDMYLDSKGSRLHTRINCQESDLVINRELQNAELVEKMKTITCMMQEKLRQKPIISQVVRYFDAESGAYSYATNVFRAECVHLAQYVVPGHHFVNYLELDQPILKGNAESGSITFGKNIHFTAKKFKADFYEVSL